MASRENMLILLKAWYVPFTSQEELSVMDVRDREICEGGKCISMLLLCEYESLHSINQVMVVVWLTFLFQFHNLQFCFLYWFWLGWSYFSSQWPVRGWVLGMCWKQCWQHRNILILAECLHNAKAFPASHPAPPVSGLWGLQKFGGDTAGTDDPQDIPDRIGQGCQRLAGHHHNHQMWSENYLGFLSLVFHGFVFTCLFFLLFFFFLHFYPNGSLFHLTQ